MAYELACSPAASVEASVFGANVICRKIRAGELSHATLAGLVEPLLGRVVDAPDGPALEKMIQSIAAAAVHTNSCSGLLTLALIIILTLPVLPAGLLSSPALSKLPAKRFLTLLRRGVQMLYARAGPRASLRRGSGPVSVTPCRLWV